MARKGEDGVKHSKKGNAKDNRKRNVYSQKGARFKELMMEKAQEKKQNKELKS